MTVKNKYSHAQLAACAALRQNGGMKNLAEIRKRRKLSQTQLAELAGCTQGVISKIEQGKANPTLDVIESIADALRVPPALLFGLTDLQDRVIFAFGEISADRQDAALTVLDAMASAHKDHK